MLELGGRLRLRTSDPVARRITRTAGAEPCDVKCSHWFIKNHVLPLIGLLTGRGRGVKVSSGSGMLICTSAKVGHVLGSRSRSADESDWHLDPLTPRETPHEL